jgi:hypothetical protein
MDRARGWFELPLNTFTIGSFAAAAKNKKPPISVTLQKGFPILTTPLRPTQAQAKIFFWFDLP